MFLPSNWNEDSDFASISSSGLLSAGSVSSDQPINITASYTQDGVTKTGTFKVAIVNHIHTHRLTSFDTDGKGDVLLRNLETGRWEINFLNNRFVKTNSGPTWLFPGPDWKMMGTGDFNGSGYGDILLRNQITSGWRMFFMQGREYTNEAPSFSLDMNWQLAGLGDFDGDGMDDVLLRNRLTGIWKINFMDGSLIKPNSGPTWLFLSLDWEMLGTNDLNSGVDRRVGN